MSDVQTGRDLWAQVHGKGEPEAQSKEFTDGDLMSRARRGDKDAAAQLRQRRTQDPENVHTT